MSHPTSSPWPVDAVAVGDVSAGAVTFRQNGRISISAIVKATFSLVSDGTMTPTPPPIPLRTAEQPHSKKNPEGSVRAPLDTVPRLRSAEVFFAGDAYAPEGTSVPSMSVRLALRSAKGEWLIDKPLEVLGDRSMTRARAMPEPEPFTRMPLIYERAYGSPGNKANPVGIGELLGENGRYQVANIVHTARPPRPAVAPAGFGPISLRWHARARMLAMLRTKREMLDLAIAEIPDDLDPSYFQRAAKSPKNPGTYVRAPRATSGAPVVNVPGA